MTPKRHALLDGLSLESGPPWHVSLVVEPAGPDLVCRIVRGAGRAGGAGAVARSHWEMRRAATACLRAGSSGERSIAVDVAHRLCKEAQRDVTCTIDLELHRRPQADQVEIHGVAHELAAAAGQRLRETRLRASLEDPDGLPRLLSANTDRLEARIDEILATPVEELVVRHGSAVAEAHASCFGRRVLLFAPLYLSSACLNDCVYCGFRRSARIGRLRLSVEQALAEARQLAERGHRTLDLVTGEIPTDAFVDYVCEVCAVIREDSPIERINLNLGALTDEQYVRLVKAGASAYHLYQETYDAEAYRRVHRSGPKQDMAYRLGAARRVLRAGFEAIGLGILLGLASPRTDLARLARHAHLLLREFPGARLGFSLPRIQPATQEAGLLEAARVDDETFVKALLFLRLEFPAAHLTLTTRESAALRDTLLPLGITKISAGVSTSPGGYSASELADAPQFSIRDERSLGEMVERVRSAGLVPSFQ